MPAAQAALAACQRHSPDGWIRVPPAALAAIVLEHVCTVQDLSLLGDEPPGEPRAVLAGITEWQSRVDGRLVSLGWDWLRLHDGAVVPDTTVAPRTNLMPLDALGYDIWGAGQAAALWHLISRTDWQAVTAHAATVGPD